VRLRPDDQGLSVGDLGRVADLQSVYKSGVVAVAHVDVVPMIVDN
jgi:hypothetical protein